jgi:hypothetical protein
MWRKIKGQGLNRLFVFAAAKEFVVVFLFGVVIVDGRLQDGLPGLFLRLFRAMRAGCRVDGLEERKHIETPRIRFAGQ